MKQIKIVNKVYILLFICIISHHIFAQNITIIESQSYKPGHIMDTVWNNVATEMGLNSAIVPQDALGSISNLSSTDVLIISSGIITITPSYFQTLIDFVTNGGSAYIQSEYSLSSAGSIIFDELMMAVGADFSWDTTVTGVLDSLKILGDLSTTPNNVPTLNYFWYGLAGGGTGVDPFIELNGDYFGFSYVDSISKNGTVITASDEDWILFSISIELMENILTKLLKNSTYNAGDNYDNEILIYPNPTNGVFYIRDVMEFEQLSVFNVLGEVVYTTTIVKEEEMVDLQGFPKGMYIVRCYADDKVWRGKLILE